MGSGGSQAVFFHFPDMITLKPLCATPTRTCVSQSAGEKHSEFKATLILLREGEGLQIMGAAFALPVNLLTRCQLMKAKET